MAAAGIATPAAADDPPAYLTSPFHGVTDGNGNIIPCRCRFDGRQIPVGETVCMSTPSGPEIARCDLFQNNTTWVPTGRSCKVSSLKASRRLAAAR